MRHKSLPLVAIIVLTVATLAGGYFGSARAQRAPSGATDEVPEDLTDGFKEALLTIQDSYAGKVDLETLGRDSIQGMLRQLDPHSTFFTKQEFDDIQTEQSSRTYGIGVTIAKRYDHVYILSATPGSPGHRAGLRYGDAIVAIDKENVADWTSDRVMHKVRGEKGEPVEITVERAGAPNPITVHIRRDEVKLPSVRSAFMTGQTGTGYIALTGGFSSKTDEEMTEALAHLKQEGMRQLVLDLRGNPGGLLDEAIKISKKFLAPGEKIVEVRGREGASSLHSYEAPDDNAPETMPMVILVNRQTASASEIVAGALQDHDRALIVGENSFGKGLVQGVFHLWGGTGLVLTTAKYYTPKGRSVQRNYSNVSFYDYYLNRGETEQTAASAHGDAFTTDLGRTVYGGGGITPDIEVKSAEVGRSRGRLFYGIFDFVRQLAAGQLTGLREYRITETQHRNKITSEETNRYPITDELVAAFRQYIAARPQFNLSEDRFNANLPYIRTQMRREIITAAYGPEAGEQVYLPDDSQFRKAIESLDQARMLADNASRARGDRQ
ncbi:MAG TPA: S41 family peptidase [Blastocatellia bacterium]|nr:S41 family peptidase [Blastocatellia bacterium]